MILFLLLSRPNKFSFVQIPLRKGRVLGTIDLNYIHDRGDNGGRKSTSAVGALQSGGCAQETLNRVFNEDKLN